MVAATLRVVGFVAVWTGEMVDHNLNRLANLLAPSRNDSALPTTVGSLPVHVNVNELMAELGTDRIILEGNDLLIMPTERGVIVAEGRTAVLPSGNAHIN